MAKTKVLFICLWNISRSRTAERMMTGSDKYEVKSAGFFMEKGRSGQLINQTLIDWADIVVVMDEKDDKHMTRLYFNFDMGNKPVVVLGIPNIYKPGDPVLDKVLKEKLALIGMVGGGL